jgi:hypothetical protein
MDILLGPIRFVRKWKDHMTWKLKIDVWLLEGLEKSSGREFAVAYAGLETQKNYFAQMAFQANWKESPLGRQWLWQVPARVRRESPGCALLVYELEKAKEGFLARSGLLCSPVWVRFELPLDPGGYSTTTRYRHKDMQRKIRKHGFTSSVSRSEADFDDFYHNMYMPYVQKRHTSASLVHPYEDMKKNFLAPGSWFLPITRAGGSPAGSSIIRKRTPIILMPA